MANEETVGKITIDVEVKPVAEGIDERRDDSQGTDDSQAAKAPASDVTITGVVEAPIMERGSGDVAAEQNKAGKESAMNVHPNQHQDGQPEEAAATSGAGLRGIEDMKPQRREEPAE